jgi:flagellar biosynthesis anti-sigma factor FlgM
MKRETDTNRVGRRNKTGLFSNKGKKSSGGNSESPDTFTKSPKSRTIVKALSYLYEIPDVRKTRVLELRELIENGKYEINYRELATRIVHDLTKFRAVSE